MRLRIDREQVADATVIRISGHLVSSALPDLEAECGAATGRLILDLSELRLADPESLAFLRGLAAAGVGLEGASHFIAMLLSPVAEPLNGENATYAASDHTNTRRTKG